MTYEQIIKYWNEIDSEIINEHGEEFDVYITMPVAKSTVDLISRQKAEVEKLKIYSENLEISQEHLLNVCAVARETAKAEAIKEFAERLKKYAVVNEASLDGEEIIDVEDVDNLVKEMTEEING